MVIGTTLIKPGYDKLNIIKPKFLIYTPIIFRDNKNSSNAKKNLEKFEIVNFLYNY